MPHAACGQSGFSNAGRDILRDRANGIPNSADGDTTGTKGCAGEHVMGFRDGQRRFSESGCALSEVVNGRPSCADRLDGEYHANWQKRDIGKNVPGQPKGADLARPVAVSPGNAADHTS